MYLSIHVLTTLLVFSAFSIGRSDCRRRKWSVNGNGVSGRQEGSIHFYLYNNNGFDWPYKEILPGDMASVNASGFTSNTLTVLLTHGFGSGMDAVSIGNVTQAYLNAKQNGVLKANYIGVDWSELAGYAGGPSAIYSYSKAVHNIPIVSIQVAQFLANLVNWGLLSPAQTHLVGHSVGGQLMGRAGWEFQNITNGAWGKLGRITALDPAGPCFGDGLPGRILTSNDASFVDVINTDWDYFGTDKILGHATFLVNNGMNPQPGCSSYWWNPASSCSHTYAVFVFAQSMTEQLIGCQLPDGTTPFNLTSPVVGCNNPIVMGPYAPITVHGVFHVDASDYQVPSDVEESVNNGESLISSLVSCGGS